ncbi:MAG: exodeoxyribonuclease VII small subunit [Lachnospiraceae bacterium]|nr:exodeoxyribonuclease VII small subunit [Lachnospiraceae bacterium]
MENSEKNITAEPTENDTRAKEEMSVEDAFDRLEVLIGELEKSDLSLEASFAFYEEGMNLVKFCSNALDRVGKKVLVLSRDGELDEF